MLNQLFKIYDKVLQSILNVKNICNTKYIINLFL